MLCLHWIFCLNFVGFYPPPPPAPFNYSCRQLFARALNPRGKSQEIYMKKAGVPSYLPIEYTHSDRLFGWARPIPVLTSETSVQDPQTVCLHSQNSDFAQVYNTHFTVLTAQPTAPARAELDNFCHSKFPLRHKPLISQVHLAFICLGLLAKTHRIPGTNFYI